MHQIPLTLLDMQGDGYHLLIDIKVFGQTFKAVLDTGASKTVFDKTTIEHFLDEHTALQDTEMVSTGLGTNSMESFLLMVKELEIGELSLRNQEIAVLDLSTINHAYGQMELAPVIGVLGGDILKKYGAVIDYRKEVLRLRKRAVKGQKLLK